ncbi:hypothetical protein GCM10009850_027410 [Nonomuraea monospora]|uniref:Double-GTPase 2 domain-containing protein n=1 Tax=Nonomuraea monospora TaxID=568818 RepID=A0ABP5P6F4_9ACTN
MSGYYGGSQSRYRRNPVPSGDGAAVGCGCLVAMCLSPLLLWLLIPATSVMVVCATGHCLYEYLKRLASVMGVGRWAAAAPVPPPPDRPAGRNEPAYVHYLFGPALVDLRHAVRVALPAPWQVGRRYDHLIRRTFQGRDPAGLMVPLGIVSWLSMAVGIGSGFLVVTMLCLIQLTIVGLMAFAVIAAGFVLRAADSGMRVVKGVRTSCPSCHQHVHYPSYDCSASSCGRRHRDIRPGRFGVVKRRCACGTLLPTLLIMGSGDGRMRAFCPHCGEPMSAGAGAVPEIVIPVLGAATTGKTRLMTALVMGLVEGPGGHGATTRFADEQSANAYRGLADKLRAGVHTWKTIKAKDAPLRAYSLRVAPPSGSPRLLHIFDAPGELVGRSELLRELRYIKVARTFLFTLDLLSVDAVWASLPPEEQARQAQLRSDVPTDFVFGQLVQNIEGLGVATTRARLVVALTKDDLVCHSPVLAGVGHGSEDIRRWLEGPAGLDGVVRTMRRHFGEIRFFRTSSWLHDGLIDHSVLDLSGWILAKEGLRVHNSA